MPELLPLCQQDSKYTRYVPVSVVSSTEELPRRVLELKKKTCAKKKKYFFFYSSAMSAMKAAEQTWFER